MPFLRPFFLTAKRVQANLFKDGTVIVSMLRTARLFIQKKEFERNKVFTAGHRGEIS
jgi:hypothetical protein